MVEEDTWEPRENLENVQELVDRFEEEYGKETRKIKKRNLKEDYKRELPERYIRKTKKKMSKNTRRVGQRNGTKKMRQIIYKTHIMSYKVLGTRTLKKRILS